MKRFKLYFRLALSFIRIFTNLSDRDRESKKLLEEFYFKRCLFLKVESSNSQDLVHILGISKTFRVPGINFHRYPKKSARSARRYSYRARIEICGIKLNSLIHFKMILEVCHEECCITFPRGGHMDLKYLLLDLKYL